MNRRKRNKQEDNHISESWLIPYADILTLLLALFIVLFAASTIDAQKFQKIASSFNSALTGGNGPLDYQEPIAINDNPSKDSIVQPKDYPADGEMDKAQLQELKEEIDGYISENQLSLSLKTTLTEGGLVVTILDNALFDSGSAEVKPNARKLANEISQFLVSEPPREIIIAGHTDNVPINNSHYDSNWVLSFFRAYNFMEILLNNTNLDPNMLSPIAHGEYKPVASNKTASGRAKNRRVEIKILPFTE